MDPRSPKPTEVAAFAASLARASPPPGLDNALQALWHAAKGDWKKAHDLAQDQDDEAGAWVHAYLHRIEGDLANADYWYRQAGRKRPKAALDDEWRDIVAALLKSRAEDVDA